jgi:hypothetical protein
VLLRTRELDELGDECRHLPELLDDVRQKPAPLPRRKRPVARENLDVRPYARQRRAQLVGRVRDELALCARRLLERPEHRVETRSQPAQLVRPFHLDAFREVLGLRDPLDGGRETRNGSQRRPRDDEPQSGGDHDSAERDEHQEDADPVERLLDLRSGRETCIAAPDRTRT